MPGPRNPPQSPAEIQLRGTKLAAIGKVTAPATLARAATFRAVAIRLVLDGRQVSLGVPRWLVLAAESVTQ